MAGKKYKVTLNMGKWRPPVIGGVSDPNAQYSRGGFKFSQNSENGNYSHIVDESVLTAVSGGLGVGVSKKFGQAQPSPILDPNLYAEEVRGSYKPEKEKDRG